MLLTTGIVSMRWNHAFIDSSGVLYSTVRAMQVRGNDLERPIKHGSSLGLRHLGVRRERCRKGIKYGKWRVKEGWDAGLEHTSQAKAQYG